ncbi:MAG: ABC-F family ATP-binding cassette domain-containing protein [Proteobacteria bacterium]|nr:ABC-F family ATP-binding cassette domain-containing protein [Pseudomonadota bacterium]
MFLINAQNISKSYGVIPLFKDISFNISEGERLGLIGPNGCGKSTFLKILMGLETPDNGKIVKSRNVHTVYLAQTDVFNSYDTVQTVLFENKANLLGQADCQYLIREVTFSDSVFNLDQKISSLSGGWRKRIAIIKALLQKPTVLLMDEPTNHLDLEGILWLEEILNKTNCAYVLVSHDRYLLENCTNVIMELNRVYIDGYLKNSGNYSDFLQKREQILSGQIQQEQVLLNKMRREQEWLQRQPKARTTKAQYRIDNAEKLRENLRLLKTSNLQNRKAGINFDATGRKTKILISLNQVALTREHKKLFSNLSLKLTPGFCLGLMGPNGSGKSSLINLLKGDLLPAQGVIERADNLRIINFDQHRQQLNQQQTLWHALAPDSDSVTFRGQNIHVAAWAKRFLFAVDQLHQSVSRLSGGEQARVLIANLMLQPADILLLDEPTNDLDIATLEILEDSLSDFPGAIVLITHDRYLIDRLSDQLLYLDGDGHAEFFADYAQWRQSLQSRGQSSITSSPEKIAKTKKLTYEEQKELQRLPDKIQKAEAAVAALQAQLSEPHIMNDQTRLLQLCKEIETANSKVESLYQRWQELEASNSRSA